ncbi:MAG: hypothetical protein HY322_18620 [Betaproteobacteria bacterium]|nr:hypothetical protein [Betaproteobacteria bacterium]
MRRNHYRKAKEMLVTPPAVYQVPAAPDSELLIEREQHELASVISEAVAQISSRSSEATRVALRKRAEKLSPAARITARVLTKLRLNIRYPPKRSL